MGQLQSSVTQRAESSLARSNLVIVGCNIGGMFLIRKFLASGEWRHFNITFIDKNNYIEWFQDLKVYLLKPDDVDYYLWRTDTYFEKHKLKQKNMTFLHATVNNIQSYGADQGGKIDLEGNAAGVLSLEYDYLMICSGVQYGQPIKTQHLTWEGRKTELERWWNCLVGCNDIVVVGGGPVGVEFAGQLATEVGSDSGINVHLVTRGRKLLERHPSDAGIYALDSLTRLKVKVHFKTDVDEFRKTLPDDTTVYLPDVSKPNAGFLENESFKSAVAWNGGIKVNKYMQVVGFTNVFAFGDCCEFEVSVEKSVPALTQFGTVAFNNLCKLVKGDMPLLEAPEYPEFIQIVPLGKNDGLMVLNFKTVKRGKSVNKIHDAVISKIHDIERLMKADRMNPFMLRFIGFLSKTFWFSAISSRYRNKVLARKANIDKNQSIS